MSVLQFFVFFSLNLIAACAVFALILHLLNPYIDRLIALLESRVQTQRDLALKTREVPPEALVIPVREAPPADLIQICMQESEGWARDQALRTLWEAYDDKPDWNYVRGILLAQQMSEDQAH